MRSGTLLAIVHLDVVTARVELLFERALDLAGNPVRCGPPA
jgi:hypothetical protein